MRFETWFSPSIQSSLHFETKFADALEECPVRCCTYTKIHKHTQIDHCTKHENFDYIFTPSADYFLEQNCQTTCLTLWWTRFVLAWKWSYTCFCTECMSGSLPKHGPWCEDNYWSNSTITASSIFLPMARSDSISQYLHAISEGSEIWICKFNLS